MRKPLLPHYEEIFQQTFGTFERSDSSALYTAFSIGIETCQKELEEMKKLVKRLENALDRKVYGRVTEGHGNEN